MNSCDQSDKQATASTENHVSSNPAISPENTVKSRDQCLGEIQPESIVSKNQLISLPECGDTTNFPSREIGQSNDESSTSRITGELKKIIRFSTHDKIKRIRTERNLHSSTYALNFLRPWCCNRKVCFSEYVEERYLYWAHPQLFTAEADKQKIDILFDHIYKKFENCLNF